MSIAAQVTSYIVAAMISWVPLGNQIEREHDGRWIHDSRGYYVVEDRDEVRARYERIASEIVAVAFDPGNTPLFGDRVADGRLKTALILASIASFEGGYHKWVENGDCNTPAFQARQTKEHAECDGGLAWSNWQIHLYRYIIKDGEMTQAQYLENSLVPEDRAWMKAHEEEVIHGKDLAADPKLAAQVAYYLVRYSTRGFKSLCSYTGEDCGGNHPKASQRWERAVQYLSSHPFVAMEETSLEEQLLEIMTGRPSRSILRSLRSRGVFAMAVPSLQLN